MQVPRRASTRQSRGARVSQARHDERSRKGMTPCQKVDLPEEEAKKYVCRRKAEPSFRIAADLAPRMGVCLDAHKLFAVMAGTFSSRHCNMRGNVFPPGTSAIACKHLSFMVCV